MIKVPSDRGYLFCFGFGYSAEALARQLKEKGWRVGGTCRSDARRRTLAASGIDAWLFDDERPLADAGAILAGVTDVLISVPPSELGDPVVRLHGEDLAKLSDVRWVGYLSTTGVYGDTGNTLVDETAPLDPSSPRSRRRVAAEAAWLDLGSRHHLPVHVFRLAGIYGPARSTLDQVRAGTARRIDRPGHLFSRIHVDDIAIVLQASMARPAPDRVYNVCDDVPAEPQEVVAYACRLLDVPAPPLVPFEVAAAHMSAMARSFWNDRRRVDNARIKHELGVRLAYPDYRAGLSAILAAEAGVSATAAESERDMALGAIGPSAPSQGLPA